MYVDKIIIDIVLLYNKNIIEITLDFVASTSLYLCYGQ